MFVELQKLKSPFGQKAMELAAVFIAPLLFSVVPADDADIVRDFVRHRSSVKESLQGRIKAVLLEKSIENGTEAFQILRNDGSIRELLSQVEVELNEQKPLRVS